MATIVRWTRQILPLKVHCLAFWIVTPQLEEHKSSKNFPRAKGLNE